MRVCAGVLDTLLQGSNVMDEFLTVVIRQSTTVWFNTSNFPKTEVGSGKSGAPVQTLENLEMKKTLVALAALAATSAFAQSSVTITGAVDAGYKAVTHDKNGTTPWTGIAGNNTATSNITFKGVEDMGQGLKASFLFEVDPTVDRSTTLNQSTTNLGQAYSGSSAVNGEQYVGLTGKFGDIKLGAPNSPALTAGTASQPFGTALGGGFSAGFGRLGTATVSGLNQYVGGPSSGGRIIRSEKSAVYTTPAFAGVTGQVEYSAKNNNGAYTSNDIGLLGLAANYNNGPVNVTYYNGKASAGSVTAAGTGSAFGTVAANSLDPAHSVTWNILGANYTMGAATVYAGYSTTKTSEGQTATASEDSKSWNIAGKYVFGQYDFLANYLVRKSNLSSTNAAGAAITGYEPTQTLLGLGVNYNLSKRTNLYARYEAISGLNAKAAAAANGAPAVSAFGDAKQTVTAIGVKHTF
jgi:predicted porin